MRALLTDGEGGLELVDVPMPRINSRQALVRTLACGVCAGTDAKIVHGSFKGVEQYPVCLGHEAVGEVVSVGADVTSFAVGDVVTLPFLYEPAGDATPAWGAFAEYGVVGDAAAYAAAGIEPGRDGYDSTFDAQRVVRLTERLDAVGAAMLVTFREVLTAVRYFGFEPGQTVVVFGAGPVGLSFVRMAALLGLRVLAVDRVPEKVADALAMGAEAALDSTRTDPVAWVRGLVPEGVDYVVDAVGVNSIVNQGMAMIRDRGKLCVYGISPSLEMSLDWSAAPYNWQLVFHQFPRKAEEGAVHDQVVEWIETGLLDPAAFVSHTFPVDRVLDAFDLVERRLPDTKKIVITY